MVSQWRGVAPVLDYGVWASCEIISGHMYGVFHRWCKGVRSGRGGVSAMLALGLILVATATPWPPSALARDGGRSAGRDSAIPSFEKQKRQLLDLEKSLRQHPDDALTGVPGMAVVMLSCADSGCRGEQQIRLGGLENVGDMALWLPKVFAAGGWVPVALPRTGVPAELVWTGDGRFETVQVPLPEPGWITVVRRDKAGLVVSPAVQPTAETGYKAALAETARGDRLAAIAVLEAADSVLGGLSPSQQLYRADLLREAGLPEQATQAYLTLAYTKGALTDTIVAARLGLAKLALEAGRYDDVLVRLADLKLRDGHPRADAVKDLLIQALYAQDRARDAIDKYPSGGNDPFLRFNRAMAYQAIGDTFSAVSELQKGIKLANREVPVEANLRERALLALGMILAEQNKLDDALAAFGQMNPDGPYADRLRFARGLAFYSNRELIKAVAEFQALERDHSYSPYALEGMLVMADAFRELNASRQAVTEYRKALERSQNRGGSIDRLLEQARTGPFSEGMTGMLFGAPGRRARMAGQVNPAIGANIVLSHAGFERVVSDYRQIGRSRARLESVKRRLLAMGRNYDAERVSGGQDRLATWEGLFETAARDLVIELMAAERRQVEELSITASLGITQSVVFDSTGRSSKGLVFPEGK